MKAQIVSIVFAFNVWLTCEFIDVMGFEFVTDLNKEMGLIRELISNIVDVGETIHSLKNQS